MLPTKPTKKAIGQAITAKMKNKGSSPRPILSQKSFPKMTTKRLKNRLCNKIKTTIAKGLMPVSNKNFLRFPFTFFFNVNIINIAPLKEKIINGSKKRSEPLNRFLIEGTNN